MKNTIAKYGFSFVAAGLILFGWTGLTVLQAAEGETNLLFKVHVEKQNEKENIEVSIPLSIVQSVYPALPKDVKEKLEKQGFKVESILSEMDKMIGTDLVQVDDKDSKIRVYVEKAKEAKDADFLKVQITEAGKETPKVNVCIPKGFVALALELGKGLDLYKNCQLPPLMNTDVPKHE